MIKTSPLAPKTFPELPFIPGISLFTANTGIRYKGRPDLLLVEFAQGTTVAGTFTTSKLPAAPVDWCKKALRTGEGEARGLIVNAGNANAFTGKVGNDSVQHIIGAAAELLDCKKKSIYMASTGVIGEPLKDDMILAALPKIYTGKKMASWEEAARSIMTTDTFVKMATRTAMIGDTPVTINGFAKGSGMIAPNMATLLSFIFTDAAIPAPALQALLLKWMDWLE